VNGCTASLNTTVTSNTTPPVAGLSSSNNFSCTTTSATLTATGGGLYNFGNGFVASNTQTVTAAGIYTVTVQDVNNGCTAKTTITVLQAAGISAATVLQQPICYNDNTGKITINNVQNAAAPLEYSIDNLPNVTTNEFTGLAAGNHIVRITDANGCEWSQVIELLNPTPLEASLGNDKTIALGDTVKLSASLNQGLPLTYQWAGTNAISCLNCAHPLVNPVTTAVYTVTVTNTKRCTARATITINVENTAGVYIPTVFTPNEDGRNDIFTVYAGRNVQKINKMLIFDRSGELVYETQNIAIGGNAGWNGRFKDQELNSSVFVYLIEVAFTDGTSKQYSGDITLLR
jgi:gliding motility-associated-like protein